MRVRQPGEPKRPGGQQLVVGDDECSGRIPHVDAAGREPLQLAGAALDAVEALAHVEPGERDVPRLEERQRRVRLEQLGSSRPQDARCGDERFVRRAAPVGDDGELHAEDRADCRHCSGRRSGDAAGVECDPLTMRAERRLPSLATGSSR